MKRLKNFENFNVIDENIGTWWNKFIDYGKKGLLTAAILLSVAFSAQSQKQNKSIDELIKALK